MRKLVFAGFLFLAVVPLPAYGGTYDENLARDFGRGFKNVAFCWLEIPVTMGEYHRGPGRPLVRHGAGFADGVFQTIERFGSGAWDFAAGLIPGQQEGLPVEPEVLV